MWCFVLTKLPRLESIFKVDAPRLLVTLHSGSAKVGFGPRQIRCCPKFTHGDICGSTGNPILAVDLSHDPINQGFQRRTGAAMMGLVLVAQSAHDSLPISAVESDV